MSVLPADEAPTRAMPARLWPQGGWTCCGSVKCRHGCTPVGDHPRPAAAAACFVVVPGRRPAQHIRVTTGSRGARTPWHLAH
jgi:hypothetical protein